MDRPGSAAQRWRKSQPTQDRKAVVSSLRSKGSDVVVSVDRQREALLASWQKELDDVEYRCSAAALPVSRRVLTPVTQLERGANTRSTIGFSTSLQASTSMTSTPVLHSRPSRPQSAVAAERCDRFRALDTPARGSEDFVRRELEGAQEKLNWWNTFHHRHHTPHPQPQQQQHQGRTPPAHRVEDHGGSAPTTAANHVRDSPNKRAPSPTHGVDLTSPRVDGALGVARLPQRPLSPSRSLERAQSALSAGAVQHLTASTKAFADHPVIVDGSLLAGLDGKDPLMDEWGPRPTSAIARRVASTRRFAQRGLLTDLTDADDTRRALGPTPVQENTKSAPVRLHLLNIGSAEADAEGSHALQSPLESVLKEVQLTPSRSTPPPAVQHVVTMDVSVLSLAKRSPVERRRKAHDGGGLRAVDDAWRSAADDAARETALLQRRPHSPARTGVDGEPTHQSLAVIGSGSIPASDPFSGDANQSGVSRAKTERRDTSHRSRLDPIYGKVQVTTAQRYNEHHHVQHQHHQPTTPAGGLATSSGCGVEPEEEEGDVWGPVFQGFMPRQVDGKVKEQQGDASWILEPIIDVDVPLVATEASFFSPPKPLSPGLVSMSSATFTSPAAKRAAAAATTPNKPQRSNLRHAVVVAVGRYTNECRASVDLQPETDGAETAVLLRSMGFDVTLLSTAPQTPPDAAPTRVNILDTVKTAWKHSQKALLRCKQLLRTPGPHLTNGTLDLNPQAQCVVVFFGAGYVGSFLGSANRHWLLPMEAQPSALNAATCLSLEDLACAADAGESQHLKEALPTAPGDATANFVICDAMSVNRLQSAATESAGFCIVGGRRSIGSALMATFSAKHYRLGAYYVKRALDGHATRDSRLTANSLNTYLAAKFTKFGAKVETNALQVLVGDCVFATATQMQRTRADIPAYKAVSHKRLATISVTLIPMANQDHRSNAFLRELIGTIAEAVPRARNELKCCGRTMTGRLAVLARFSPEAVSWGTDSTYRRLHEMKASAQLLKLFRTATQYRVRVIAGRTVAGVLTFPTTLALLNALSVISRDPAMVLASRDGAGERTTFVDPPVASVSLDATPSTGFGVETTVTFNCTEYTAMKVDRALRNGKGNGNDRFAVVQVQVSVVGDQLARRHESSILIQAAFRGWWHRRRFGAAFRLMRLESRTRAEYAAARADFVVTTQRVAFGEARDALARFAQSLRGELDEVQREEWIDVVRLARNSLTRIEAKHRDRLGWHLEQQHDLIVMNEAYLRMTTLEAPRIVFVSGLAVALRTTLKETAMRQLILDEEDIARKRIRASARNWNIL